MTGIYGYVRDLGRQFGALWPASPKSNVGSSVSLHLASQTETEPAWEERAHRAEIYAMHASTRSEGRKK